MATINKNNSIATLAAVLGGETKSKTESATNAELFTNAGLAFGETKPEPSAIDAMCNTASTAYRKAANVTADDKTHKKMLSHLRAYIAMGALVIDNKSGSEIASDLLKVAAEKVTVPDHVNGGTKEQVRIPGGVRETIYSASVWLQKALKDGIEPGWYDELVDHLEPEGLNARKAMKAIKRNLAILFGVITPAEQDMLAVEQAQTLVAMYDVCEKVTFEKPKVPAANATLDALRKRVTK